MIYVITHKKFDDSFVDKKNFVILHVGKNSDCDQTYCRDDIGENISYKNPSYCELTGLYWIWKNGTETGSDIVGLVHYRRYFTTKIADLLYVYCNRMPQVLKMDTVRTALRTHDIILPKRIMMFRTVREFYDEFHIKEDMNLVRKAISELFPEYLGAFDRVMQAHSYYYGNMMICSKRLMDEYAAWLFKILYWTEGKIDMGKHTDPYQRRVFGFLAERLLQVWVLQKGLRVKEYPVFNTEEKHLNFFQVNWIRVKNALKRFN